MGGRGLLGPWRCCYGASLEVRVPPEPGRAVLRLRRGKKSHMKILL